jgi:hypothetical protein
MDFDDHSYRRMGSGFRADEFMASDPVEIEARAAGWASDLADKLTGAAQLDALTAPLAALVTAPDWDGPLLTRALRCTNIDWRADEAGESELRQVIRELIAAIERDKRSRLARSAADW